MATQEYLIVEHLSTADIIRIFSRVTVNSDTGCWIFNGPPSRGNSYQQIKWKGKMELVHRLTCSWLVGPLPKGKTKSTPEIDHIICSNPACCFPAHMNLVSKDQNRLRGNCLSAVNSRKTVCKRGHELVRYKNQRICKTCAANGQQRRRDAKRTVPYKPRPSLIGNKHALKT